MNSFSSIIIGLGPARLSTTRIQRLFFLILIAALLGAIVGLRPTAAKLSDSSPELTGRQLSSVVDSKAITIASLFTEQAKLTDTLDGEMNDEFGASVAISGDTAIVGVPRDESGGNQRGSALVFTRTGSMWSLQQKLTAMDGADGDLYGWSVAVDGDTAIVAARNDDILVGMMNNADQGSVYVYTRSGGVWTQQQKLTASDGGTADLFGHNISVDADTVMAGTLSKSAAYVFTRSGGVWTQQQKLTAAGALGFGNAVAVDGDTAIVGAPDTHLDANFENEGAAYVFTRSGGVWTQQAMLIDPPPSDDFAQFGISVGISGDTVIIGAPVGVGVGIGGKAFIFTRSGMTWTLQQQLVPSDAESQQNFGISIAIDGERVVVGSNLDDLVMATDNRGSAYAYERVAGVWGAEEKLTGSDSVDGDAFGTSVDISSCLVIAGAPSHNIMASLNQGSAYVFLICTPPVVADLQLTKSDSTDPVASGGSLTYTLTVTNNGPNDATAVVVTDMLPAGVSYLSNTCSASPAAGSTFTWNIGNLASGASVMCQISVTVTPIPGCSAMLSNMASVTGSETDANLANNSDSETTMVVNSPLISCPANITVNADAGQCSASVPFSVTAMGNPSPTVTCKIGMTTITSPHTFPVGVTTVDCTATNGCLPDPTCSFTVTVSDTQPPQITCPPTQVATPGVVNYPAPTTSDNCSVAMTTCTPPSGSVFPLGVTTVTCTATDASGNMATCNFTVTTFDVCLQDNSNSANVLLFNSLSGAYQFCCSGTVFTGKGTISKKGSLISLEHNSVDRRVLAKVDTAQKKGTASLQSPSGTLRCSISDSNTMNNSCTCN